MNIELKYINAHVSEINDETNKLLLNVDKRSKEIVSYFNIKDFKPKVELTIFNDLNKFKDSLTKIGIKNIPDWLCGEAITKDGKRYIYTLTIKELIKTKTHENYKTIDLENLIIHEFVHSCESIKSNTHKLPLWLSEGMAIYLSDQQDGTKFSFNASLDEMINGKTNYLNYYSMYYYVLNKYGKDYIINLIEDKNLRNKMNQVLYKEATSYYKDYFLNIE